MLNFNQESITDFERLYQDLFTLVLTKGVYSSEKTRTKYVDGTVAKRKQVIGVSFRINNSTDKAPILRSRNTPVKGSISELAWIWLLQSNNVQQLRDMGCKFWDEWEGEDGTIGPAYGYIMAKKTFGHDNQLAYILHELNNNPDSTRIKANLWDVDSLHLMKLTPCVYDTTFNVIDGKLYLILNIRSSDLALGLPANIYQYSVLQRIIARECNLECADLIVSIANLHIYDRHEDLLIEQFKNYKENIKGTELDMIPTINILPHDSIWNFRSNHVELKSNNKYLPVYKYEIAI